MPEKRIGAIAVAPGTNVARHDNVIINRGGIDRRARLNGELVVPAFQLTDANKKLSVNEEGTATEWVEGGYSQDFTLPVDMNGKTLRDLYNFIVVEMREGGTAVARSLLFPFSDQSVSTTIAKTYWDAHASRSVSYSVSLVAVVNSTNTNITFTKSKTSDNSNTINLNTISYAYYGVA